MTFDMTLKKPELISQTVTLQLFLEAKITTFGIAVHCQSYVIRDGGVNLASQLVTLRVRVQLARGRFFPVLVSVFDLLFKVNCTNLNVPRIKLPVSEVWQLLRLKPETYRMAKLGSGLYQACIFVYY